MLEILLCVFGTGILLALLFYFFAPASLDEQERRAVGVGILMVVWWVSEALPMPVVALLPLVAFPLLGINKTEAVAASYANPAIYLFLEALCWAWPLKNGICTKG